MHERARIAIPIILVLALIGGGSWWWNQQSATAAQQGPLTASGTIESEQVLVTAEIAGRIRELPASEGQVVVSGETLAQLDTALLEAQLAQARAGLALAEAQLALLRAGARPEEVALAAAQVEQAQALRNGAFTSLENAKRMLSNPQELNIQIVQAQAARDAARQELVKLRAGTRPEDLQAVQALHDQALIGVQSVRDRLSASKTQAEAAMLQAAQALTQAQARYAQAKYNWEYARDTGRDPINPTIYNAQTGQPLRENTLSDGGRELYYAQFVQAEAAMKQAEQAVEQARVAYDAARAAEVSGIQNAEQQVIQADAQLDKARNGATREDLALAQTQLASTQLALDTLLEMRENPQQLQVAVDNATTQLAQAESQVAQAQARLDLVREGARQEQIQAAEAQVSQARAAIAQIEVQIAKATLKAPRDGIILSRPAQQGEYTTPGGTILTIGTLNPVRLTIYIGETDIGRVKLGQQVDVTVDSSPGRVFPGTVTFLAQEAEFTPRNVQTKDERVTTVFAVRVELPNDDGVLKPGMPADAVLR